MSSSSDVRGPVELLADEFLARHKAGEKPTIGEYCDRHPDLAEEIRAVFEALLMMEDLKPGSDDVSGSFGDSVRVNGKRLERVGDYRILREIGRGGMGVVYEAEQEALGRRVALKVLPKSLTGDGKALIRFQREAKAAARMHHTNIVPVFDVGQDGDHVYYAMQLIHGQGLDLVIDDLKRLRAHSVNAARADNGADEKSIAASLMQGRFEQENLAQGAPAETAAYDASPTSSAALPGQSELSSAESNRRAYYRGVAQVGLQTASALAYAHARGIIHRDIKPGNLLLDAAGNVWVTDFGLAKTGDAGVTHTGDILGTIRYMAPERFNGECDVRADVYALGLTMYEMLVLKPAFASADRLKLIEQIRQADPPSPRTLDPRIPRDLETIIVKAIDKDPKRRYQSADELADDLQRFVADEPIKARRIGPIERFTRWCRRSPAVASLTAAVVLLMVTGTSLSAWQAVRATRAEQIALHEKESTLAALEFFRLAVLGQAHPEQEADRSLTLFEAIHRASKELDARPPQSPLVEASIRVIFGDLYLALGDFEKARSHLQRAWELRHENLGDQHPDTAMALALHASTFAQDQSGFVKAEKDLEDAVAVMRKARGPEHPDTLRVTFELASSHFRQYVAGMDRYVAGSTHRAKSIELLEQILAIRRRTLTVKHPETLRTMNLLSWTLGVGLNPKEADLKRAEVLSRESLDISRDLFRERKHPLSLSAMDTLARALRQQGRDDEAFPLAMEAHRIAAEVLRENHHVTIHLEGQLVIYHCDAGNWAEAERLADKVVKWRTNHGANYPQAWIAIPKGYLALSRIKLGKFADAYDPAKEYVDILKKLKIENWVRDHAEHLMGASLLGQKKYKDTNLEPLLVESCDRLLNQVTEIPPSLRWRVTDAVERVVDYYNAIGREDLAAPYQKKLIERRNAKK